MVYCVMLSGARVRAPSAALCHIVVLSCARARAPRAAMMDEVKAQREQQRSLASRELEAAGGRHFAFLWRCLHAITLRAAASRSRAEADAAMRAAAHAWASEREQVCRVGGGLWARVGGKERCASRPGRQLLEGERGRAVEDQSKAVAQAVRQASYCAGRRIARATGSLRDFLSRRRLIVPLRRPLLLHGTTRLL